ncbi:MAG: protocatechuate 3,4-dioxygenase subunit beta [Actinomycetota bacterium]|nr:protocatechuate 3,4-dioxygenase subunit beta [Actinomycetota bacterium]MDA8396315.1 protocatechuate 3,4-dioxygenase subunit beta [Actinomycetota bacterium]
MTAGNYAEDGTRIDPPYGSPGYASTGTRQPKQPLVVLPERLAERNGPLFDMERIHGNLTDLTAQHPGGEPVGERINLSGRLLDGSGRPLAGQLIEIWQANAAGRYAHAGDRHSAPLDPHFTGAGRTITGADGSFNFLTIKPGPYPWHNNPNAWRPSHIHFSVFGRSFAERLITQMYFPGDPLLEYDPIFQSIRSEKARARLISSFDWETTQAEWAIGYRFDIVVGGHLATPLEDL